MESFESSFVINKETSKELDKALISPSKKKAYVIVIVISLGIIAFGIARDNVDLWFNTLLVVPAILSMRYLISLHLRMSTLTSGARRKRKRNKMSTKELEFILQLQEDGVHIRDAIFDNKIRKIDYRTLKWLVESKNYYILLQKEMTMGEANGFGAIEKAAINDIGKKEEFIDFIKEKNPKIKIRLKK